VLARLGRRDRQHALHPDEPPRAFTSTTCEYHVLGRLVDASNAVVASTI
jgi:hypothetical protein